MHCDRTIFGCFCTVSEQFARQKQHTIGIVIKRRRTENGRYRRLVPDELDQLQGFPKGWTNTGMTDGNRAFCMGNALVVGVPHLIGCEIAKQLLG